MPGGVSFGKPCSAQAASLKMIMATYSANTWMAPKAVVPQDEKPEGNRSDQGERGSPCRQHPFPRVVDVSIEVMDTQRLTADGGLLLPTFRVRTGRYPLRGQMIASDKFDLDYSIPQHQAAGASPSTGVNAAGPNAPLMVRAASTAAGVPSMTIPSCLNA